MATAADLLRTVRPERVDPLRVRLRLRRLATRLAVVILLGVAFVTGVVARSSLADPAGEPSAADLVAVPVATRDLDAGQTITDGDVAIRTLPAEAIPSAFASEPIGLTVSSPIYEGELISTARLGAGGRFGLDDGHVAIGVIPPIAPIPTTPGDVVTLVAVGLDPSGGAAARPLGRARVVEVDERAITVAVDEHLAPAVLEAQAVGTVEIALTPWGP